MAVIGRQKHRAQTLRARPDDRLDRVHSGIAQAVERVDQHDVVVHHDAGERQHAGAGHDDREGLPHDHHAEQRADHRKYDGHQDQCGMVEAVEQHQQHKRDQEQRQERSHAKEALRFILLLGAALERDADARREVLGRDPRLDLGNLRVRIDARA